MPPLAPIEPLSGADTTWLRLDEAHNPMTINALLRFERPLGFEGLRALAEERLLPFRRFRQRIDDTLGDSPRWVPDEGFDLDAHLLRDRLIAPTEEALQATVTRHVNRRLSLARSPWELVHIEGLEGGTDALVVRIHHSVADGFSLLYLMLALVDDPAHVELPTGPTPPPPTPRHDSPETGPIQGARQLGRALGQLPIHLVAGLLADVPHTTARLLTLPLQAQSSLDGPLRGEQSVAWSRRFSVKAVKDAAHRQQGTLNDALLAVAAGGLRRYLLERGEAVEERLDVRCTIPVNLLPFEARQDAFGNGFGLVYADLPVGAASPQERMARVHRQMERLKHSAEAFVIMALLETIGRMPLSVHRWLVDWRFRQRASAVVTNLPGPRGGIALGGRRVADLMFWVPQSVGIGLGLSILTYDGHGRIGVIVDLARVPEPAAIAAAIDQELEACGL